MNDVTIMMLILRVLIRALGMLLWERRRWTSLDNTARDENRQGKSLSRTTSPVGGDTTTKENTSKTYGYSGPCGWISPPGSACSRRSWWPAAAGRDTRMWTCCRGSPASAGQSSRGWCTGWSSRAPWWWRCGIWISARREEEDTHSVGAFTWKVPCYSHFMILFFFFFSDFLFLVAPLA